MRIVLFLLKRLPLLLVFVIVWVLAILFWRMTDNVPSIGVIALVLLGVPIALIVGYFGLKKGFEVAKSRHAAKQQPEGDAQNAAEEGAAGDDPERAFSLQILAGGLRLSNGADATELIAAIKDNKSPALHPSLVDHRGLPVFAATVDAADPDAVETAWDVIGSEPSEALETPHRRALALAAQLVDDLVVEAGGHVEVPAPEEPAAAEPLEAVLLLPEDWPEATREAGRDWLQQHADQSTEESVRLQIKMLPVAGACQALTTLDEYRLTLNRRQEDRPRLLFACDSRIDEETVHRWSTTGRLKASGNEEGQVPGEGAAGLLVARPPPEDEQAAPEEPAASESEAPAAKEEAADEPAPFAHLYRIARGAYDQPNHGGGRRNKPSILDDLITEALADAECEPGSVGCMVSDGDTRPSRSLELAQSVDGTLPELDSAADVLSLSAVAGACGCATELAGIAVATFQMQEQQMPTLFASVADDQIRTASVVALPTMVGAAEEEPAEEANAA